MGFLDKSLIFGLLPHTHTGNSGGQVQPLANFLKHSFTDLFILCRSPVLSPAPFCLYAQHSTLI